MMEQKDLRTNYGKAENAADNGDDRDGFLV